MRQFHGRWWGLRPRLAPMPGRYTAHIAVAAFLLIAALGLQQPNAQAALPKTGNDSRPGRPLLLPTADVTLAVPATVQIGQSFSFTATFDNTDPDETGYGPFIDMVFPVIGADGAGAATDDGIDFVGATFLGAPVTAVQQTFGAANTGGCAGGLGPVSHPYAIDNTNTPLLVCGTPGNKLVTLQLPFGSFTPDQPPAVVTVNATLSNLADAGTPLTLRARGGYQYGATPLNDWCCGDVSIVSQPGTSTSWPGAPTAPAVLSLTKTYNGPEDETATGPNFPRQYTLTVDIAAGQLVTNLTVTDTLPNNMQFISAASAVPAAACTAPSTTTPGGTLTCNFGAVTGGATASDATVTFNFFIPLNNAGGAPVINASSGDDVTSLNTSSVTGSWDPIDARDPITPVSAGGVCPTGCHTLTDKSIAIQKSVANVVDVGYIGNSPGDTLEYTLTFQVSDSFSFQDIVVTDVISDGQRADPAFTSTLQVNGNGFTSAAADMDGANYTLFVNADNNPGTPATDGSSILTFRVTDELITRGESGRLIGGCVPVGGTGGPAPDCGLYDDGATTGTIVFRTIIQQDFTDTYPSGDPSVDHGDILRDNVTVGGDLLSVSNNLTLTGGSESDDSAASLSIAFGTLAKSVYAVNGTVCTPCTTEITTNGVNPGDSVTFRLRYVQPSSDFEQTTLTDYLPLPIFDATTVIPPFSNTVCGVPASGNACLGPADTYHSLNGPPVNEPNPVVTPVMTTDSTNNFVRFFYADYDSATNTTSEIDLLFSVTVSNQPFADGLFLTNQADATEGTTNAGSQALDTILQIKINEPLLIPKKSAVSTDSTAGGITFTPPIGAPIAFDTPGVVDGTADWSGGVISSNYLAANPINADLTGVDAGDLVKFAIVIENQGHSIDGAFDIAIKDAKPPEYDIPASGLNLEVFLGDGVTPVAFTDLGGGLFGNGIQLVDPGVPPTGACQAHNATSGQNVIIITYDLQLSGSVALSQNIVNTTTLLSYSGTEAGPNFIPSGVTDTATVTPITAPVKSIVTTSESHTSESGSGATNDPRLVAIGEIVRYRITIGVAEGTVPNFRLHDNLPAGLLFLNDGTARVAFVSTGGAITSSTLSGPGLNAVGDETTVASVVPTFQLPDAAVSVSDTANNDTYVAGAGTDVFFMMGDLVNPDRDIDREFVVVEFNALVENIAGNGTGTNRENTATYRVGTSTSDSNASNIIRVRTVQPSITMGKSIVSLPPPVDAGGLVAYRITVSNGTGANITTAFDVRITDVLPSQLTLNLPVTVTLAGGAAGVTDASAGSNVDVTVASIPAGGSVTVDYTATINATVTPAQIVSNSSLATWTSLPGTNGTTGNLTGSNTPGNFGDANGERNGSGTGPNNYRAVSSRNFTSAAPTVVKQLTATSASHTSGSDVAIGEEITYDILLTFPEGTTPADTVVDDLPTGLEVVGGTPEVITTAAASGGLLAADFNATIGSQSISVVPGDGGSVTFNFTNVVVTGDNDTTNNTILLRFRAVVSDIAANVAGTTISNSATNQVGAGAPTSSNTVTATVVEPSITFGKTIVSLPSPLDAGGVVHYRITYANGTGAAVSTAMDVSITDALATALLLPSTTAPDLVITSTAGVGAVTNNSTASNIDITIASVPPGESLTVDFFPVIQDTITPGQVIDNVGNSTWTSLSGAVTGERTGADGPAGSPDNYAALTATQSFTAGSFTISKQLTDTSASHTTGSNVTIGEEVTYAILLTFPEGTTPADTVVDDLPTDLAVVTGTEEVVTLASLSSSLLTADFSGSIGSQSITSVPGDGGSVTFNFASVVVAGDNDTTNNTVLLRFRARVTDVAGNVGFPVATTLSNSATNQVGAGTPTSSNAVDVTVVEPRPVITKTFTPASGTVNDVIRVTLTYQNTGTSNAYDVVITDALDSTKFTTLTPVTTPAGFTFSTSGTNPITVQYAANSGVAVAPAATVAFEFDIMLTANIVPGELLPNTANVTQTTTLDSSTTDGDDANERNTTASDTENLTVNPTDMSINKSHIGNFTLNVDGTFTISVRNVSANAATGTIRVTDTLPNELTFVSASGTDWTCTNIGQAITCTHPGPVFGVAILPDIVVVVRPNTATGSPFSNTATVAITGTDTNSANNSDTDTVDVVTTNPDLMIVKTHSGNFTVGSVGSFSLTVTNVGAQPTSATITVTDTLPPELDFVSAGGTGWACTNAASVVTCTHPGPLFPPASLPVITLAVVPNTATGSPFTNNATVLTSGDTNAANNNASDSVSVNSGPAPDLTITKTHTGNFTVGTNGSFTLTVTNIGAADTVGTITVTDTLPTELTFVSAAGTNWMCTNVGQTVTCTHPGPLGVGSSLPAITLAVNPTTATGSPFSNTASVSTPGDGNSTNNSATDSVIVTASGAPDLIVTKTHTGNFVVGTPGVFTLAVTNAGTGPTTGAITLTDTLPAELDYTTFSGAGWTCNLTTAGPPNDVVTCTHPGPLAVGGTLSVDLTVNPLTDVGSPFINNASVATPGESNTGNNSDTDSVVVTSAAAPDLAIVKTHVGNFTVGVNNSFTFTVTNVGSGPTTAPITVTDTLPTGLTFVSVSGSGWDCSATAAPNVSCTHPGPLAPANVLPVITLTVTPTAATPPPIANTAVVATTGDANNTNDSSTDNVTVAAAAGPDLTIVKSHLSNFVVGVDGVYTFRVRNVGSAATTGAITLTDTLQTGLAFVSASSTDANWDCSTSSGVNVTCTHPGPLAAGASLADLNLTVSVGAAAIGTFNNVATVSTPGDTNSSNDTSTDSTTVTATPQPDLAISKSHTGTFAIGTTGTYTIRVRNVGSQATAGAISVIDNLQAGLTFVSAAGTNWLCNAAGQTVTCNYQMPPATPPGSGESLPDITITMNVGLAALGVFNNVATVSTTGDTNPANDTAIDQTIVPFTIDLSLTNTVNTSTPNVGDTVVFTITVSNAGPHAATNATVSGISLGSLTLLSATPSQGTFNAAIGVWTIGNVAVNGTQTLVLSARVNDSNPLGFTAQVATASEVDVDSTPGNDVASEDDQAPVLITPVAAAGKPVIIVDPTIAKRLPIENAQIGDVVEFSIRVTNPNGVPVAGVSVADPLPPLVDFVSATTAQGTFTFDAATNTVTFDIGTMAAGQVVEITVRARVNERGQPPFDLCNDAAMLIDGQARAQSGPACAHILPSEIPATGVGPGPREWVVTILLWLVAAFTPLAIWRSWRTLRRRQS